MPGVLQVTFYYSDKCGVVPWHRNQQQSTSHSKPSCWSLPTVLLSSHGEHRHPLVLHERVAEALGVEEGDPVIFSLRDCSLKNTVCNINNKDLFTLLASIADADAPFDVALESHSDRTRHIFDGTLHDARIGRNFLRLTNGTMLKISEQDERVYRAPQFKSSNDWNCRGMMVHAEGVLDYYNHNHGAGCGFCLYASTPLALTLKPSDCMVQGYRYLGTTHNPHEAVYHALWEALLWVFRLDFQTVWIVGSAPPVFRQVLNGNYNDHDGERCNEVQKKVQSLLERARQMRLQLKFLSTNDQSGQAMDLATRAIVERRNETSCYWSTINYQSQRNLPFSKTLARQVSI